MLTAIKQRHDREDEGFTLIELMVVVLIIAILLAIAIPTFLGARNTANSRAAQSNLRNAITAEQTQWTNTQAFSSTPGTMSGIEAALYWVDGTSATPSVASTDPHPNEVLAISSDSGNVVVVTALGKDNKCWSMAQVNDPSLTAVEGTSYYQVAATNTSGVYSCTNPTAPASRGTGSAGSTASTWETTF